MWHYCSLFSLFVCGNFRIKQAEKQYLDAFNDELSAFKQRVHERAEVRLENARKEVEEEERQARLGPGGLDPIEVMESLPEVSVVLRLG